MRNLSILAVLLFCHTNIYAAVSIGLSGATSNSNYALENQKSSIVSANVSLGVASFARVGLTHRRSFQEKSGLKKIVGETEIIYYEFEDNTDIVTNSVDLTIILYPGYVSPFIFGGIARRDYYTEVRYPGSSSKGKTTLPAVPNYGIGIAIQLNRHFSLKITQTYTPGLSTTIEEGEEVNEVVNDTYTQIGINYRI